MEKLMQRRCQKEMGGCSARTALSITENGRQGCFMVQDAIYGIEDNTMAVSSTGSNTAMASSFSRRMTNGAYTPLSLSTAYEMAPELKPV